MRPRLRLYPGDDHATMLSAEPQVSVKFGEFTRIITDACRFERTWLSDFEHDEVQVPEDLFEVLTAYARLRPGA